MADDRRTAPTARVAAAYRRIREVDRPEIWITLRSERDVLDDALGIEQRLDDGDELPLAGLLAAVKDNIDVAELPTTAGCPDFTYTPTTSATAVQRLVDAGAIVIGTTNLDQFATGLVGTRSPYGPVRCAWDATRISGGSSSGSAVAVALGIADVALGTDTAGSGRVPAALNGVVGVKPTLGLVPVTGVIPACADYDAVTTFTRDLPTATRTLRQLIGSDPQDPRCRPWPADTPLAATDRPHVAVPRDEDLAALSPTYRVAFAATIDSLQHRGISTGTVDITPLLEAARLLYDGAIVAQRYAAVGEFLATRPPTADPTVAAIILAARDVRATDYAADLEHLAVARQTARQLLEGYDALIVPTTTEHPTIAEVHAEPLAINRRLGTYTNFVNLLDLAAVAVPGNPTADGAPFGITLVVPAFADQIALDLATRLAGQDAGPAVPDIGVELAVFGAHLRGQPLNHQLRELHARYCEPIRTSDGYRLVTIDTHPPKPGLVKHGNHTGARIHGELWQLTRHALGTLLADLPPPMSLAPVDLDDGRCVVGFGCTYEAAVAGTDITHHRSWPGYLAQQ